MENLLGFAFGWIGISVLIMTLTQLKAYFILQDILKELKNNMQD